MGRKTGFSKLFLLVDLQVVELVIIRVTAVHELKGLWYQEMQIVTVTRTGSKDKVFLSVASQLASA